MKYLKISIIFIFLQLIVGCGNNNQATGTNINEEFLPVEQAFQFSHEQIDATTVKLSWKIAEGYHLYKNKFNFSLEPDSARIADVQMPKGVMLDDKVFGRQESYKNAVSMQLKLKAEESLDSVKLITKYQGCSEKGLCYPPEKRSVPIKM